MIDMPALRAAIARAAEPFTADDIMHALGLAAASREAVRQVLWRLATSAELEQLLNPGARKRAGVRGSYLRTSAFRSEEFNPDQQRLGAELLQALALAWGARRPSDRRDVYAEAHADQ